MGKDDEQVLKRSAILIGAGRKPRMYRTLDDVPAELRRKLEESTGGMNSGVILIANQPGKERVLRALDSLPRRTPARRRHFLRAAWIAAALAAAWVTWFVLARGLSR